ncbi:hypothetical protein D3C76_1385060 [compost metagenome]
MVDVADGDPRPVAAVHPKLAEDLLRPLAVSLQRFHIKVHRIRVVINRQKLLVQPAAVEVPGLLEDIVQRSPGLLMGDIVGQRTPAGIHHVVEAGPLDALLLHQLEDQRQLGNVVPVHGEAQAYLLALADAAAHAPHGQLEGSGPVAEIIMDLAYPIQADAHIAHTQLLDPAGGRFVN